MPLKMHDFYPTLSHKPPIVTVPFSFLLTLIPQVSHYWTVEKYMKRSLTRTTHYTRWEKEPCGLIESTTYHFCLSFRVLLLIQSIPNWL